MDSRINLQQPILDGGIRSINFFNGRLLSARDLTREQTAYREADRRLGQAVGEGIAYGLQVTSASDSTNESPAVSVDAGLAINRLGQTLMLPARRDIALVRSAESNLPSNGFNECLPLQTGTYVAGAGVYLLTISPAQGVEGRAATNGLNSALASCNTDTLVSAVQFRLIHINPPITAAELQDENHLRNLIAYKCFGVTDTTGFTADPFEAEMTQWGLLDSLRPNQLTECEVPLAVLYWTLEGGIRFIDMWSVRRRLVRVTGPATRSPRVDDRFVSEGEAMIEQFHEHLAAMPALFGDLPNVKATDHFQYLPPAGLVPLNGVGGLSGFEYQKFFAGVKYRKPVFMNGARVRRLLRIAACFPPVEIATREMIWLYWVRENMETIHKTSTGQPQPYMVFSNGHIPFQGEARYDLAHYDYGNYGARLVEGG